MPCSARQRSALAPSAGRKDREIEIVDPPGDRVGFGFYAGKDSNALPGAA